MDKNNRVEIISIILSTIAILIGIGFIAYDEGYKAGQVDAIIGNVKYMAVNNTKWVLIK